MPANCGHGHTRSRSGFKVRTACVIAERPVRSLNLDRVTRCCHGTVSYHLRSGEHVKIWRPGLCLFRMLMTSCIPSLSFADCSYILLQCCFVSFATQRSNTMSTVERILRPGSLAVLQKSQQRPRRPEDLSPSRSFAEVNSRSGFKVRTTCVAAESSVQSLNPNCEVASAMCN